MIATRYLFPFAVLLFIVAPSSAQESVEPVIVVEQERDKLVVMIKKGNETELFTEYRFLDYAKPILYPVMAAGNVPITRHYPMDDGHSGEAQDHPHHKSLWFAHGDVNGVDFWSEKGTIWHRAVERIGDGQFTVTHDWMDGETKICEERTTVRFIVVGDMRIIDYFVTITASEGELVFGDTKEGTFAVRTHPSLRLLDKQGNEAGSAINSAGTRGKEIWGEKASWVRYQGNIDGQQYHIVLMDHRDNLRHPTTWHAREYGLVAANPFGLQHFQNAEPGTGEHTVAAGESLRLRYAVVTTRGELYPAQIDARYQAWLAYEVDP